MPSDTLRPVAPPEVHTSPRRPAAPAPLPDPLPRYLNHAEAAAYLRLSPRTLETLVARGDLHPIRSGLRKRVYAVAALDKYLRLSVGGRIRA